MANAGASYISIETGICGPTYTVSTACSSSNHAIGQAFWLVRSGAAEAAVTGGSEAPFSMGNLRAWEAMRVVSPDTCRPFSKNRRGMVLGEGGGHAGARAARGRTARGARKFTARSSGFGMSSDAHHLTQPSTDGPARAIRAALRDGGIAPEQIGYINAHGTATPTNDPTETAAIRMALGAARRPGRDEFHEIDARPYAGRSGRSRSSGDAAGAFNGILPPTANYEEPDPQCDLDVIPNQARCAAVEFALSNSFAFGGLNAVLAFRAAQ